ncbi:hypothetical protein E2C01_020011 [Portunus trituberculatus]|uniref:Uncharacterized protein n=1 Tax=Portunus trituberculatus TaxID=210409 RepID=A0A5B7DZ30_PORTR|nr:hypothetical protein [Portunus trituberculatus]
MRVTNHRFTVAAARHGTSHARSPFPLTSPGLLHHETGGEAAGPLSPPSSGPPSSPPSHQPCTAHQHQNTASLLCLPTFWLLRRKYLGRKLMQRMSMVLLRVAKVPFLNTLSTASLLLLCVPPPRLCQPSCENSQTPMKPVLKWPHVPPVPLFPLC